MQYTTKNALKFWYRAYERHQNLWIGSTPRLLKFSEEQKQAALEHYSSQGRCISWTMLALEYQRYWRAQFIEADIRWYNEATSKCRWVAEVRSNTVKASAYHLKKFQFPVRIPGSVKGI